MASTASSSTETHRYAILMETNGAEFESWYYFIRYDGNEDALAFLQNQLLSVEWCIIDDLGTFDLELSYLVSEQTAREMCKVDLNSQSFHRKFDGTLEMIDFDLDDDDDDEDRIEKINRLIGYGNIDRFITYEDPCDSDYDGGDRSEDDEDDDDEDDDEDDDDKKSAKKETTRSSDRDRERDHSDKKDATRSSDHDLSVDKKKEKSDRTRDEDKKKEKSDRDRARDEDKKRK